MDDDTAAAGAGGLDGVLMHSRDHMLKSHRTAAVLYAYAACGGAPENTSMPKIPRRACKFISMRMVPCFPCTLCVFIVYRY
jgi:hypothetical protein